MSFRDFDYLLKPSYNSANDDILEDFYNIVLSQSKRYDRISGFFNSTSLAIAARGIDKFIKNNGHMRLICSAQLNEDDLNSINNAEDLKNIIDKNFLEDYGSIEDELIKNHVKILGWMIANNYLEIKIGISRKNGQYFNGGILHSKVGILYDENEDSILFDGSVNETAYGWKNNIESLKVFKSWKNFEFMAEDIDDFNEFWSGNSSSLELFDVPDATKNKLIDIAPKSKEDLNALLLNSNNHSKPKLRDYQQNAVKNWIDNGYRGIFSMATGTGKTFTALSCFDHLRKIKNELLTVIACPQAHLITQWEDNLKEFFDGDIIVVPGSNNKWQKDLLALISDLISGLKKQVVIFTTFNTFSSDKFIDKIKKYDGESLLIVDEVHGIGAPEFRKGLINIDYTYRLGLSATPEIEDDFERTDLVFNYFKNIVYSYDLGTAMKKGFLSHYNYYPIFVDLDDEEYEQYRKYTVQLSYFGKNLSLNEEKNLNSLLSKRRDVVNNAKSKFIHLKNFLMDNPDIKDLLIYCTGEQLPKVQRILDECDISNKKFTGEESTKKVNGKSERDRILELFKNGYYRVLVGIKCLDEGVDVPSTQNAFLMASTLNSRQHIQRRGRILRKSHGKDMANIYDLIVFPRNIKKEPEYVKKIVYNEIKRYEEYVDLAENFTECSNKLMKRWSM